MPKTRSGKIMRRILRKLASNETDQLGDVSTLLNPDIVDEIKRELTIWKILPEHLKLWIVKLIFCKYFH